MSQGIVMEEEDLSLFSMLMLFHIVMEEEDLSLFSMLMLFHDDALTHPSLLCSSFSSFPMLKLLFLLYSNTEPFSQAFRARVV